MSEISEFYSFSSSFTTVEKTTIRWIAQLPFKIYVKKKNIDINYLWMNETVPRLGRFPTQRQEKMNGVSNRKSKLNTLK